MRSHLPFPKAIDSGSVETTNMSAPFWVAISFLLVLVEIPIPPCADNEYEETAWGIPEYGKKFAPFVINRPKVTMDHDVKLEMLFCAICHSDLHVGYNHLGKTMYPFVPGHELIGRVVEIGPKVTKLKVGDNVGVGVIADSCLNCKSCEIGDEPYCLGGKCVG